MTRDYSMSLIMSDFRRWSEHREERDPAQLFDACFESTRDKLALDTSVPDFDLIFLDLCLYRHPDLVQSVFNVMMIHHNLREIMLNDLQSSQLLIQPNDQDQARILRKDLTELRSSAEQAELWSGGR